MVILPVIDIGVGRSHTEDASNSGMIASVQISSILCISKSLLPGIIRLPVDHDAPVNLEARYFDAQQLAVEAVFQRLPAWLPGDGARGLWGRVHSRV